MQLQLLTPPAPSSDAAPLLSILDRHPQQTCAELKGCTANFLALALSSRFQDCPILSRIDAARLLSMQKCQARQGQSALPLPGRAHNLVVRSRNVQKAHSSASSMAL